MGKSAPGALSSDDALIYQLLSCGMNIQVLVYESGSTSFGLARSCQQAGIPVMVAAPSRVIRPVSSTAKTDSLDCCRMAELARKDMVRSIGIPTDIVQKAITAVARKLAIVLWRLTLEERSYRPA